MIRRDACHAERLRVLLAVHFARGLMSGLGSPCYEAARLASRRFGLRLWDVLRELPHAPPSAWDHDPCRARPTRRPARATETEGEETAA